jgi:polar amino acid transport system substrate-binding protein
MRYLLLASLLPALLGPGNATARSLESIRQRGVITLCAHPNALPFASRQGDVPGFQVEVARALAKQLGVSLQQHWVVNTFQYRRADCDIILDAIADRAMLAEVG